MKILTLTNDGIAHLAGTGITIPSWRRGGPAHEYWRATIRQLLERHGYNVTDEYGIGEQQAVDLHATKNNHEVIIEIETGKSDINSNVEKCRLLPGSIVFFFVTSELRDAWSKQVTGLNTALALSPHDLERLAETLR